MSNLQLSKNLRILRRTHGFTQKYISTLLNISRQAYSNYERSLRSPDLESLLILADLYQITLDQLVFQDTASAVFEQKHPWTPAKIRDTRDTLYITDAECRFLMAYRDMDAPSKAIVEEFLNSRSQIPKTKESH